METSDVEDRKEPERSRRQYREWLRGRSVSRRQSESRPPSATRGHKDEFEHRSLGRVSKMSAKKGRISYLLYDTVQEEKLLVWCETGGWSVEYALKARPVSDCGQRDIDTALDDQAQHPEGPGRIYLGPG